MKFDPKNIPAELRPTESILEKIDIGLPHIDVTSVTPSFDYSEFENQLQNSIDVMSKSSAERQQQWDEIRKATIETSENTAEISDDMKVVIRNQNNYIKMLEEQNKMLEKQNEILKLQNDTIKNIFASGEDGVAVQKEIMKILQDQEANNGMLKDKSLDGVLQAFFLAVQIFLKARGVDF